VADLLLDIRYAWRRLRAAPSFALIAIGTLAAGIGATTAVYSLMHAMLFRSPHIPNLDRIVNINGGGGGPSMSLSWPDYQDLRSAQTVFDRMAAWTRIRTPLSGDGPAQIVLGEAVEGTYFDLLGVRVATGRAIGPADDSPSAPAVVVLGDTLWRTRYASDPAIVGRVIRINSKPFEVVGVAPASFRGVDMPNVQPAAFWIPIGAGIGTDDLDLTNRRRRAVRVKGLLAPGRTIAQAREEIRAVANRLDNAHPGQVSAATGRARRERASWHVVPASSVYMHESVDRLGLPISYGVMAALALVLLIACVNIANLLLARAAGRRVEMATRIAIGASRGRLFRQLIVENALVCALGGAAGLFVAYVLTRFMALDFNIGRGLSFGFEPRLEWPVLLVAMAATFIAGLAFGLAPALQGARVDVRAAMAGDAAYRRRRVSGKRMLVVVQVGFSIAFLALGGLFIRGFAAYAAHDPGFDLSATSLATFEVRYRWHGDHDAARRFLARVRDEARSLPGVSAAAVVSAMPIGNPGPGYVSAAAAEHALRDRDVARSLSFLVTDPGALSVFGIPLVRGRFFDARDTAGAAPSAVVNETAARDVFGTAAVVGRRMRFLTQPYAGEPAPVEVVATIVGVIRDSDVGWIGRPDDRGLMLVPFEQFRQHDGRAVTIALRSAGDPDAAATALERVAREIDADVVAYTDTGANLMANDVVPTRIGAAVAGGMGALAFLLALIGLYGVMSHLVASRTREIGIRMALGAEASRVLRLMLKEGASLVAAGAAFGLLLAYWLALVVRRLIFGAGEQSVVVLATVTVLLAAVALVACWIPARRAARVDPNVALRHL
jgi:putative ABC transport system permease protein